MYVQQKQRQSEKIKLEEKMLGLEAKINEACAQKELDFGKIGDLMDEYDLVERRLGQITQLVDKLFPAE